MMILPPVRAVNYKLAPDTSLKVGVIWRFQITCSGSVQVKQNAKGFEVVTAWGSVNIDLGTVEWPGPFGSLSVCSSEHSRVY